MSIIKLSLKIVLPGRTLLSATQCLNISEDSYNYMTAKSLDAREDAQNCPGWSRPKDWFNLNQTQRLEAHLDRISKTVGGVSFTYNVLDD